MKRPWLALLVCVCCMLTPVLIRAQHSISDLAGRWETSDGNTGTIEFIDGGKVQGTINGLQIPPVPYTIDFNHNPIWFDVTVMAGKTIKTLLEFVDDDTVKWQLFINGDFSFDFTESDANPVFILKRKK